MYRVIAIFTDGKDGGTRYNVGDIYPREGYTPEPGRIEELSSSKNKRGCPLIREEKEPSKVEEPKEETPEVKEEKPKKARKTRKKK